MSKWEKIANWTVTIAIAAWQAIQYIIAHHPAAIK